MVPTLKRNLRIGLGFGLTLATICSAWVLLVSFLTGSATVGPASHPIDVLTAVSIYYVGGTGSGIVVGLLLPLGRWRLGAAVGGALAVAPLYATALVAKNGFRPWERIEVVSVVLASLLVGAPAGVIVRWSPTGSHPRGGPTSK